jgi:CO/xanthine dehydrogenase Mo-binding subunit
VANARTWGPAYFTNGHPAGAFRGFGVPQAAIAHEAMMDALADKVGIDRLEFRYLNALRAGDVTATGQKLEHSVGLAACLDALRPHWRRAQDDVALFNAQNGSTRRDVGICCMRSGLCKTSLCVSDHADRPRPTARSPHSGARSISASSNMIMSRSH